MFGQFVAIGSVRKYLTARAALEFPSPRLWRHHCEVFGEDSVSLKDLFARQKQPSARLIWAFLSSLVYFRVNQQTGGVRRILELVTILITRNLLILGTATTAKKAPLPDPLYVYCTKMLFALESRTPHSDHSIA